MHIVQTLRKILPAFAFGLFSLSPTIPLAGADELLINSVKLDGDLDTSGGKVTIVATIDGDPQPSLTKRANLEVTHTFQPVPEGSFESVTLEITAIDRNLSQLTIPGVFSGPAFEVIGEDLKTFSRQTDLTQSTTALLLEFKAPLPTGTSTTITLERLHPTNNEDSLVPPILLESSPSLNISGKFKLLTNPSFPVRFHVERAELLYPVLDNPAVFPQNAVHPAADTTLLFNRGGYTLILSSRPLLDLPFTIHQSSLQLEPGQDALAGTLKVSGDVLQENPEGIFLFDHALRLRDLPNLPKGKLVQRQQGIFYLQQGTGSFQLQLPVLLPAQPSAGDPSASLNFRPAPVRYLSLASDSAQPFVLDLPGIGSFSDAKTIFLPSSGSLSLSWRLPVSSSEEFAPNSLHTLLVKEALLVRPGLLVQSYEVEVDVRQGELAGLTVPLLGDGIIRSISGPALGNWFLAPDASPNPGAARNIQIEFRQPITRKTTLQFQIQQVLPAFPAEIAPTRLGFPEALRVSHQLTVSTTGSVKARIAPSESLRQLSRERRESRLYQISVPTAPLALLVEDVVPVVRANALILQRLQFVGKIIEARFDLEVREAPLQRVSFELPSAYLLTSVEAPALQDYRVNRADGLNPRLEIDFARPISTPFSIQIKLELPGSFQDEVAQDFPTLKLLDVQSLTGHLGIIAENGIAVSEESFSGLAPVATAFFPAKAPGLSLSYRLRDQDWSLSTSNRVLPRTIVVESAHLYHFEEERLIGSSLLNLLVTGAPIETLTLELPKGILDPVFESPRISSWRREGNQVELKFTRPASGAFPLLITWDEPTHPDNTFSPKGVHAIGASASRGYVFLLSHAPVSLEVNNSEGAIFAVTSEEIPQDYQALFTAPLIGAFQYLDQSINLLVRTSTNPRATATPITIERAAFSTTVTREHNLRTQMDLTVKAIGAGFLAFELPPATELSRVEVDGKTVAPIFDADRRLIQLSRHSNAEKPVSVQIETIAAGSSKEAARVELPKFSAALVDGRWQVTADTGDTLRLLDSGFLPTTTDPRQARLSANFTLAISCGLIFVLGVLGRALIQTKSTGLGGLVAKSAGTTLLLVILAIAFSVLWNWQSDSTGSQATWDFSLPSIAAETEVAVLLQSTSTATPWLDKILLTSLSTALFLYLVAFYFIPAIRRIIRKPAPLAALASILLLLPFTPSPSDATIIRPPVVEEPVQPVIASQIEHSLRWNREAAVLQSRVFWNPQPGEILEFDQGSFALTATSVQSGSVLFSPGPKGVRALAREGQPAEFLLTFQQIDPTGRLLEQVSLPHAATLINRLHLAETPDGFSVLLRSEKGSFSSGQTLFLNTLAAPFLSLTPDLRADEESAEFNGTSRHALRPGLSGVETTSAYFFEWRSGNLLEFTFQIPEGLTIIGVEAGQNRLRSWTTSDSGQQLRVSLKPSAEKSASILLHGFQQSVSDLTTTKLPLPTIGNLLHGELAIQVGSAEELELVEVPGATTIRKEDVRLPSLRPSGSTPSDIRHAYRFQNLAEISIRTRVSPVRPFIRLNERLEIALTEDRTRISLQANLDVSRAGIFSLRASLPQELEVESVRAPQLMNWDLFLLPDGQRELVLEFEQEVRGSLNLAIGAASRGIENLTTWEVPKVSFANIDRYEGQLAISYEPGLRLIVAESTGTAPATDQVLHRASPNNQRLRYQLHQPDWSQSFLLETEPPVIAAEVAERIHFAAGRIRVDATINLKVERSGIKSLILDLPPHFHSVSFAEDSEFNATQVEESGNQWEIRFPNKLFGSTRLRLSYQSAQQESSGIVSMHPLGLGQANRQINYLLLSSDPRFLISGLTANPGVESVRLDQIPSGLFSAEDLGKADHLVSVRDSATPLAIKVERREVEDRVFSARIDQALIETLVSPNGGLLHRLEMKVVPGSQRFLELSLPSGHHFWSAFVNEIPTDVWSYTKGALQIPIGGSIGSELTTIEVFYQLPALGSRRPTNLSLAAPTVSGSFGRLDWYLLLPPGYDFDPDSIRRDFQLVSDDSNYLSLKRSASAPPVAKQRERAASKIAEGNLFLKQGRDEEAQRAFESAYNFSRNDLGLNRDAMTQWQNLRQQQAVRGISNNLRNVESLSQQVSQFDQQSLLVENETSLLAKRLVDRDSGGLLSTDALRPQLPSLGKTVHLSRNLIVDGSQAALLQLTLEPPTPPLHRPPYLALGILLTTFALFEWNRRR